MTKTTAAILRGERLATSSPTDAWRNGTNIRVAMRLQPGAVSVWFAGRVARMCQMVDASTTIRDDSELVAVVDALIEEFPAMKVDEWECLFREIERGRFKLYNRLKLPELMEAARQWETRRADILEREHRPEHDPFRRASSDVPKRVALMLTPEDIQILERAQTGTNQKPATPDSTN